MKTLKNNPDSYRGYMLALIVLACVLMSTRTMNGQGFTAASIAETSVGASGTVSAKNTGDDIKTIGSDIYRVCVWDDLNGSPGAGYKVYYNSTTYTGTLSFTYSTSLSDPDVCLAVDGSSVVHMLAVYHAVNSGSGYH